MAAGSPLIIGALYGVFVAAGIAILHAFLATDPHRLATTLQLLQEYDYIVVGAGTAGSVLASRLAQNSSVLLLEAGGEPSNPSRVPRAALALMKSHMDWKFVSVPQKHGAQAYVDRREVLARGKAVGGSSAINFMMHVWPSPEDTERWASLTNDDKFRFQNFHQYLMRTETFANNHSSVRGKSGRVHVSQFPCSEEDVLCTSILAAVRHQGYPVRDINSFEHYGFMPTQSAIHNGKRWTVMDGYIKPALSDPKSRLHLATNAFVNRIEMSNSRASSVSVKFKDFIRPETEIKARKGIVVSAGAIQSPQLLLRSGLGPKEHLQLMAIPQVRELPVGNNLMDHIGLLVYVYLKKPVSLTLAKLLDPVVWLEYAANSTGIAAHTGVEAVGIVPRPANKSGDLFFGFFNFATIDAYGQHEFTNVEIQSSLLLHPPSGVRDWNSHGFLIFTSFFHARSRGTVRLNSGGSPESVDIDPNYVDVEDDVDAMVDAVTICQRLIQSPSMKKLGARIHLPNLPECRPPGVLASRWKPTLGNSFYLKCWIRRAIFGFYHPAGTCRMGRESDPEAVVDSDFKVIGVDGLHVVDASVFPYHISANPQATVVALAEMAVESILRENATNTL